MQAHQVGASAAHAVLTKTLRRGNNEFDELTNEENFVLSFFSLSTIEIRKFDKFVVAPTEAKYQFDVKTI